MKNLLFDLRATQPNNSGQRHGGGKYGEIVLFRMLTLGYRPICFYSKNRWLNPEVKEYLNDNKIKLVDIDNTSLEELVARESIDTIYSCLPSKDIIQFSGCEVKGTLHGLRDIETPVDHYFWKYKNIRFKTKLKLALEELTYHIGTNWKRRAESYKLFFSNPLFSFVVVSNHTANSIVAYYPLCKDLDIPVFYSPSTSSRHPKKNRSYEEEYFLLVSGNRWEKNNLRAIIALDRLFSMGLLNNYRVRVTGCGDAKIFNYKIKNSDKFSFMGYVDEDKLEQLYHDAYCFIYPSLNEGFGYPPLEAMRYGVPVLASSFSSISEVCQGAALYYNPFSIEEIMTRILYLVKNPDDYKRISQIEYTTKQNEDLDKLIKWIYE